MGSLTLAYPSIAGKTTQEQLESMRRYLCSVTEQLNLADWSAKATLTEISQAIDADSLSEAEKKTAECVFLVGDFLLGGIDAFLLLAHPAQCGNKVGIGFCCVCIGNGVKPRE